MAGEGEGHDKEPGELFEDLDKFFSPLQDGDWPAPEEAESDWPTPPEEAEGAAPAPEEADSGFDPPAPEEAGPEPTDDVSTGSVGIPDSFYRESLTEEELPTIETTPMAGVDEGGYLPDEEDVPASTIFIDDESVGGAPEDVEEAAQHFAGSGDEPIDIEQNILADLEAPGEEPVAVKVGATEGLHGPSWQEPTSEEVGAEPSQAGAGRDVPAALLTGAAMAIVGLLALKLGRGPFAIVAGLVVLAAQAEFYGVITRRHHQPATALGLVGGALILAGGYFHGEAGMLAMFGLSTVATFVWFMATPVHHRVNVVQNIGLTLFGIAWIPFLAAPLLVLLRVEPGGAALVLAVLAMVFAYDTAAFAVGSLWGDTPLAPTVSPRKSVQGAVGATFVVAIVGLVALPMADIGWSWALLMAIVVAVLAPLGDLAESLIKRDLGVKDMGSVLPGHGGVLDRIDSVLLVAPAALIILRMVLYG